MSPEDETKHHARFSALRKDGHSDRNAARLLVKELRKGGRATISEAAILRRMQRREQKIRDSAALLERMLGGLTVAQNPVH